jgi:hypothetical protein
MEIVSARTAVSAGRPPVSAEKPVLFTGNPGPAPEAFAHPAPAPVFRVPEENA